MWQTWMYKGAIMMTKRYLSLSSGNKIQFEEHSNTEKPYFYPEKIICLKNGTVGLIRPHSKYYMSTPENQKRLEKITKQSTHWFYVNYLTNTR